MIMKRLALRGKFAERLLINITALDLMRERGSRYMLSINEYPQL